MRPLSLIFAINLFSSIVYANDELILRDCERAMMGGTIKTLERQLDLWTKTEAQCHDETINLAGNLIQEDLIRWKSFRDQCETGDDMDALRLSHERILMSQQQTNQSMIGAIFEDANCLVVGESKRPGRPG